MGLFYCSNCDAVSDSDDGCAGDPYDALRLWCADCANELLCAWCSERPATDDDMCAKCLSAKAARTLAPQREQA